MEEAEPEAEESPGTAEVEEGLTRAFSQLTVGASPRTAVPEIPRAERSDLPPAFRTAGARRLTLGSQVGLVFSDPVVPGERGLEILGRALAERYPLVRGGPEVRFYVVWQVPNYVCAEELSGLHVGLDTAAYSALVRANQGVFEGLRWRRVRTLVLGRRAFLEEANRHNVEAERVDHLFWWR